jgi:hypothetical protein
MASSGLFRGWFRRSNAPCANDVDQEVEEELMFHLRSLVDDELARGTTFDAAWDRAHGRFGSLRRYANACRGVVFNRHRFFQTSLVLLLAFAGLLAGWLLFEIRSLRQEHSTLVQSISRQATQTAETAGRPEDLTGRVLDRLGRPIGNASVAVILKTWPGGGYRQEAFSTTSDADGTFRLAGLVPLEGQYAIQAAALPPGYALTSTYRLIEEGSHPSPDPVLLQCDDASQITFVVQDDRGHPVANARVTPHSRRSSSGANHLVYFQSSGPFQASSDAAGRVGMGCFERGDEAEIYVQLPGKDWELHAIEIPHDGDTIIVPSQSS